MTAPDESDKDLFISYSHWDNEPLTKNQEGWISLFHRVLEKRLRSLLGDEPQIWRDERLSGNDYFSDVIVRQLPRVKLLISVVSPRYVRSEWCLRELREFYESCLRRNGIRVGDASRIIKVIKTPVAREECPKEMEGTLGFEFYEQIDGDRVREYDPVYGSEYEVKFIRAVDDLAQVIYKTLVASENVPGTVSKSEGVPIYLAHSTSDLAETRRSIQRELEQFGHTIHPMAEFPAVSPEYEDDVAEALAKSVLSIHLIGNRYGLIPENCDHSRDVIQVQLAKKQAASSTNFGYLLWMSPGLTSEDPEQQKFLDELRRDPHLLEVGIEELKTNILDRLEDLTHPKPARLTEIQELNEAPLVYLIADPRDSEDARHLADYLFDQGLEVRLPSIQQGEPNPREVHEENLRICDGVLIYYGSSREAWLHSKLADLRKARGYGRSTPIAVRAIYLAPPDCAEKQNLRTHDAIILHPSQAFDPAALAPFIEALKPA